MKSIKKQKNMLHIQEKILGVGYKNVLLHKYPLKQVQTMCLGA